MEKLFIEYHNPRDLVPYENNARHHEEVDLNAIRKSIHEFGFNDPIGIWSDQLIIVEGHGRQLAAIEEGLDEVPCIRRDHMTEEQRRGYALAHNKTAELSKWDFGRLDEELAGIKTIKMEDFGFEPVTTDLGDDFESVLGGVEKLPESRVVVASVSLFGTQSDVIAMARIPEDKAETLIERVSQLTEEELAKALEGGVYGI